LFQGRLPEGAMRWHISVEVHIDRCNSLHGIVIRSVEFHATPEVTDSIK